jgi:electron transfer flavoprotein beta subunit
MTSPSGSAGLNILVCMKFVPDPNQLQVDPESGRPDLTRTPFRINTFDENAIEAALQLVAAHGGRVLGVSLCPQTPPKDVMLKALAMGVGAIYLVKDADRIACDAYRVAAVLAAAARTVAARENIVAWDLLICGEASVDDYNEQVGPRLATALGMPAITYATSLSLQEAVLRADRAVEDRTETVEADLPVLATVGMEINTARMPTVLQIMGAGRKPITELTLAELDGVDAEQLERAAPVSVLDVFAPPNARKQIVIKGDSPEEIVTELLRRLGADGEVKF